MANWRARAKTGAAEVLGPKPTKRESRMAKLGQSPMPKAGVQAILASSGVAPEAVIHG